MAEFLTMQDAESHFGKKGKTNAALTLGIIGTALGAMNNSGCGNGILGNLFGGNCQQNRLDNEIQVLTNQLWAGRLQDQDEKCKMYIDLITRDNVQNLTAAQEFAKVREQDIKEKTDLFERLNTRLVELEKKDAANSAALPLMFELATVKANKYTDDCCCKAEKNLLMVDANLQRQLDRKIDGQLKYSYSNLCAPVPDISPLYCSPFTVNGSGTTYTGLSCNTCGCGVQ